MSHVALTIIKIRSIPVAFRLLSLLAILLVTEVVPPRIIGEEAGDLTSSSTRISSSQTYGQLPLSFEANHGQSDPSVRFQARGSGYSLSLTETGAVLMLRGLQVGSKSVLVKSERNSDATALRMELIGGNRTPKVSGQDLLPGQANYFIGNNQALWHSGAPTYSRVRYAAVYPGVDLMYYGRQGQVEYDFVLAPFADPSRIRMHLAGARSLALDLNGNLQITMASGRVVLTKPVLYQQDNDGRHVPVNGRFALRSGQTITFTPGRYDHARSLVIDPTLSFSTYLGGSTGSAAAAVATDQAGNVYLTGETFDADFPVMAGVAQSATKSKAGVPSAFVTKINAAGTALIFSTYLGGERGRNRRRRRRLCNCLGWWWKQLYYRPYFFG